MQMRFDRRRIPAKNFPEWDPEHEARQRTARFDGILTRSS
jgi:hypothetical protein